MQNNPIDVLGGIVDRLAQVKATIATLQTEETRLKQLLVDSKETVIEGTDHRAAISHSEGKVSIDWRAIAEHFNPSRQLVRAHSSTGEAYYAVRRCARTTS